MNTKIRNANNGKIRYTNILVLLTLSIISLLITSCGSGTGRDPLEKIPTGFEGLNIEFNDLSRKVVYTNETFFFDIDVSNTGGYNVERGTLYVPDLTSASRGEDSADEETPLDGLEKEDEVSASYSFRYIDVPGGRSEHEATITGVICYGYQNKLDIGACMGDPNEAPLDEECDIANMNDNWKWIRNGQGSPLTISMIEEKLVKRGDGYVPSFTFVVEKVNDNDEIFLSSSSSGKGDLCKGESDRFDFKLLLSSNFSYDSMKAGSSSASGQDFDCPSNANRLALIKNGLGEGKIGAQITCTLKDTYTVGIGNFYTSPLTIALDYDYRTMVSEKVLVKSFR